MPLEGARILDGHVKIRFFASYTLTVLWGSFLWAVFIYKLSSADRYDIVKHYTTWSWVMAMVFFTLDFVSLFAHSVPFKRTVYAFFFWFAWANAWVVFWIVFVILEENPEILTNNAVENGGQYSLGQVFLGERTLHVLPVLVLTLWLLLRLPELSRGTAHYAHYHKHSEPIEYHRYRRRLWYIVYVTLVPLVTIGIYALIFNPETTYGITLHPIWLFFIIVAVLVMFVTLFLQFVVEYAKLFHSRERYFFL